MGIWDVDGLAAAMPMHLMVRWMAFIGYFQPFPHRADEFYNAMNSTLIAQAAGSKRTIQDFRLTWGEKNLREPMTEEEIKRVLSE